MVGASGFGFLGFGFGLCGLGLRSLWFRVWVLCGLGLGSLWVRACRSDIQVESLSVARSWVYLRLVVFLSKSWVVAEVPQGKLRLTMMR